MSENVSPEERLLRLIRGKRSKTAAGKGAAASAGIGEFFRSLPAYFKNLGLRHLLITLFVVSWAYLIGTFIYSWVGLKNIKLPEVAPADISRAGAVGVERAANARSYESYAQAGGARQIFGGISESADTSRTGTVLGGGDMTKDISLVAIIQGEKPQAAIEDKKSQKTYYVVKGQSVGDFTVEDIQEGKIVLNNKGQRFELYL